MEKFIKELEEYIGHDYTITNIDGEVLILFTIDDINYRLECIDNPAAVAEGADEVELLIATKNGEKLVEYWGSFENALSHIIIT